MANKARKIGGMFLPLPTVFDGQGEIDGPAMEQLVDWYLDADVNAMFVLGSFGQGPACTIEQRKFVAELVTRRVNGRIPVVIHVGTVDPYTSADLARHARQVQADGIGIVGPYYYSDRNEWELTEHYKVVDAAANLPILLYNNPAYSGYPTTPGFIGKLLDAIPNVFGAKLAKGSTDEALKYRRSLPDDFSLFVPIQNMLPGMLVGVAGSISPPMALHPRLGVDFIRAIEAGDYNRAVELQLRIIQFQEALTPLRIHGRGTTQRALQMLGFPVKQYPRWPTKPMGPNEDEILRRILEEAGAFEFAPSRSAELVGAR